jgi:hypothetical protein
MHNTGTEITKTITLFYIIYKLQRKTITFLQYTNYNEKRYDSNKPDIFLYRPFLHKTWRNQITWTDGK